MVMNELIKSVRLRINDTGSIGFDSDELLDYLNGGIQWIHRLINKERPELLAEEEDISESPAVLSKKPIRILSGPSDLRIRMNGSVSTDSILPVRIRYVPDAESVKSGDEFPYYNVFRGFVIEFAAIRAQLRNEFDMSSEAQLLAGLESQVLEIIRSVQSERTDIEPFYPRRIWSGDYGDI